MALLLLTFCTIVVASGQPCTYECDSDKCFNGLKYYAVKDTVYGSICERNGEESDFFLIGRTFCNMGGEEIRDETTCGHIISSSAGFRNWRVHMQDFAEVTVAWNNSNGCKAFAQPSSWLGAEPFEFVICLETNRNVWGTVISLAGGLVAGFLWGFCSNGCKNKMCKGSDKKDVHRFKPGAKYMAAITIMSDNRVPRSLGLTRVFRLGQAAANACLPAVLPIFFHPFIVLVFYILLYVVPSASVAPVFLHSIYLVATPDISLLGIDDEQPKRLGIWGWDRKTIFLFSAIRPYIMLFFTISAAVIARLVAGDSGVALNPTGFFRTALLFGWGPTVPIAAISLTVSGTIVYSILAFILVFQKEEKPIIPISVEADIDLRSRVNSLADDITDHILQIERDMTKHERRHAIDEYFAEHEAEISGLALRQRHLFLETADAVLTFAGFCYKIWLFRRSGQYHLVFIIVCLLTQSISLILLRGTLYRSITSVPRSLYLSVRTVGYYDIVRWHENSASVFALMVTIYGLPLASSTTWWSCALSVALLAKSMLNLAITLEKAIDLDMFDAYKKNKTIIERYIEISDLEGSSMSEGESLEAEFVSDSN